MPHRRDFIVKPATLDRWEVRTTFLERWPEPVLEVTVQGWCSRRRKPLFAHSEVVAPRSEPMKASDVAHHYALVCTQDSPTTQAEFDRGLLGAHWDQPELPW